MANNTAPTPPVTENTEETTSLDTVLLVLRRYWFIIILAALAGGTAAYYLAGRQNYIYQKTASVLMRDAKTSSDASSERIMAELGIDSGAANLANESFILKSTALMKKVVEDLNLLQAKGRSDLFLRLEVWKKILGVLILCATIPFGIFFMCCGLLLLSILELGINSYYTKRLIQYGIKKQIKDILPIIGLSIASFFCALPAFYITENPFFILAMSSCIYIAIFILLSLFFRFQEIYDLKNMVLNK